MNYEAQGYDIASGFSSPYVGEPRPELDEAWQELLQRKNIDHCLLQNPNMSNRHKHTSSSGWVDKNWTTWWGSEITWWRLLRCLDGLPSAPLHRELLSFSWQQEMLMIAETSSPLPICWALFSQYDGGRKAKSCIPQLFVPIGLFSQAITNHD